ncbi:MAG: DUF2924 domain-containing protein [Pseudomonadota bacterium]
MSGDVVTPTRRLSSDSAGHSHQHLKQELADLERMDLKALKQRWAALSAHPLPPRISRELLMQAVAYEMQANEHGGLSRWAQLKLKEAATGSAGTTQMNGGGNTETSSDSVNPLGIKVQRNRRSPTPAARHAFKPGTRLVRTWGGETHEVIVSADGLFQHRGTTYRTLSQVARAITGTRWSGPRFFGLVTSSDRGRSK